ncbi:YhgE/Pip domain-containing protein [Rhodococcus sp. NPDC127528]|uniref:YhgE/Pip domain-containing protein n=1 Tax=unclassified Rhodococcus (in: high G+C Gram-positive bacteria) TaxID=192944 RepID=UPI00362A884A
MSLLAALYMGGILDPKKHLHDFPIAIVNQDEGDTVPTAEGDRPENFGNQINDALVANVPADKVDLQQIGIGQARSKLDSGQVYGAIVIPSDFTKRLLILAKASVVPGDVEKPVITVYTNPRAGTFGVGLVTAITGPALTTVDTNVGQQLTAQVDAQLGGNAQVSGAARLSLATPINVLTTPHNPLPDGTGNGLSAFYYALLLLLAGFTGGMIVHSLIDGMLGFAPTEFGPRYVHNPAVEISRFRTLLVKWAVMLVLAPLVSGLYLAISTAIGMPAPHALALWMYGAFAIAGVGITALAVLAAFGTAGLLVNLVLFVILGLPSSGATIPIEATPTVYAWLANFEPMHQVFLGVRALLYLGGGGSGDLGHAVLMTAVGLLIGLVLGVTVTTLYDRKGFHRGTVRPEPADV